MPDLAARIRRIPADSATALAFFSRFPVRSEASSFDLHQSAGAWPIAGLVIAIGPMLVFVLACAADIPSIVAAILALALYAGLTGAMHEDGLADTFDGFGGGRTREDKLAIMQDSGLGTYGALALLVVFLLRVGALAAIGLRPWHGALALIAAAVISRTLALWHWNETMPARRDGMAWAAGRPDWTALFIGLVIGALAAIALLFVFGLAALIGLVMAAAGVGLFSSFAARQIGGHTGDTIGAAQQIGEALLLAGLSAGWASIIT